MPIYEYRARQPEGGCRRCGQRFEVVQPLREAPLEHCPACDAPVERIISPPAVLGGGAHRLREGHLSRHGFTQYRRVQKGVYEKTAGRGPDSIVDDGN